jgi:hypothetical protein
MWGDDAAERIDRFRSERLIRHWRETAERELIPAPKIAAQRPWWWLRWLSVIGFPSDR